MNTIKGIVFDMDGTLIAPAIDFHAMRRAVGVMEGDILKVIEQWEEERQREARETIAEFERQARERMELMPGATELIAHLEQRGLRRAILTRNTVETVEVMMREHLDDKFAPVLDRTYSPPKPAPDALLHIMDVWEVAPEEVVMMGDSRHDLETAEAADVTTCLVCHEYNRDLWTRADIVVERLDELRHHIEAATMTPTSR